jgi:hypothetical protein
LDNQATRGCLVVAPPHEEGKEEEVEATNLEISVVEDAASSALACLPRRISISRAARIEGLHRLVMIGVCTIFNIGRE